MSAPVLDKPERGDAATPPMPEGAVVVTLKIARFDPEDPDAAGFQSFRVPCLPTDRLLNLLHYAKWYLDGTLTFRRSCAHGVCGSDAMRINGSYSKAIADGGIGGGATSLTENAL